MNPGRTYTLTDSRGDSASYYRCVEKLVDNILDLVPDESALLETVRNASLRTGILKALPGRRSQAGKILRILKDVLPPFLPGLDLHLRTLSLADRFDKTIRTSREQYLLYMVEIELTNRLNRNSFSKANWRMALIAHCLRDFRAGCRSARGEIEDICTHCDPDCFVNVGSVLLQKYHIHPYISVTMDHRRLLKRLRGVHSEMGVLGIACIPELVTGMRLCEGLGIPALGIPLDANRCTRWLGECEETTFNLKELEKLASV